MAGVIKKKKALFESEPVMPPRPKGLRIREAEGGFTVDDDGSFDSKTKVAKTMAAVIKIVKEHFGSDSEGAEDTDEDD